MHYIRSSTLKEIHDDQIGVATIRLAPSVRDILRLSAELERRSVSNMVEVMIVDYWKRLGIKENKAGVTKRGTKKNRPPIRLEGVKKQCRENAPAVYGTAA